MSATPATVPPRVVRIDVTKLLSAVEGQGPHLVTRPTGQAVRALIEARLGVVPPGALCVIDLSGVVVLDFSCADEVAARVRAAASEALLVFRCLGEAHVDQLDAVLSHHSLTAVAEVAPGRFRLLGEADASAHGAWHQLERLGVLKATGLGAPDGPGERSFGELAAAGLAFKCGASGSYHALSRLLTRQP